MRARYQFILFVVLAYALSWWSVPFANGAILPYGPALAAVIVLALVAGRAGLAELWRQVTRWRVPWIWYVAAPGLIAVIAGGAYMLNLLLGATVASTAHLQSWAVLLATAIQLLLLGGQWEEPGWTGYLLPYWQRRLGAALPYGVLIAVLITSVVRAGWHLPLVLSGAIPWFDALLYSLALQVLVTWLYNNTGGSVLIVMLFHFASNLFIGGIFIPLFAGDDRVRYTWLFIALSWLAAAAVLPGLARGRAERNPPRS